MVDSQIRQKLAFKYIRGSGIEIGPLHQPLQVPENVEIHYLDRLSFPELCRHYPEVPPDTIVRPTIIDDASCLTTIPDGSLDFVICNHVLEHMRDPIGSLVNWLRTLRAGGILYLSVPDATNPLDKGRPITLLDHLKEDFHHVNTSEDLEHYFECAKFWQKLDDARARQLAQKNWEIQYSIHYHVFNRNLLEELLSFLSSLEYHFQIIELKENEINGVREYIYIIEKTSYAEEIHCLLRKDMEKGEPQVTSTDVIIPVYNAVREFQKCLLSVLRHRSGYNIILINDGSTDSAVKDFFDSLLQYHFSWLQIIHNKENFGYVRTINKGIGLSTGDVVLLNSDTIVTSRWLEKMRVCAYSDNAIATVTPFTNNGTICSIPAFLQNNDIPPGFTVDSFGQFIEGVSLRRYPDIPTAVGFCMFIKRDVIDRIGLFDEVTFGRGYSEENDFSMRAVRAGYRNVLCDDTFIFHRGESSFSELKQDYYRMNLEKLSRRYPEYLPMVAQFCQNNPLQQFHERIAIHLQKIYQKKKILHILHHCGGGTEKYVLELVQALNNQYTFYILQVKKTALVLTEWSRYIVKERSYPLPEELPPFALENPAYYALVKGIVRELGINLIQIDHLLGHSLDIFRIAEEENIPVIFTLHDFYSVCPQIFLVDNQMKYCHEYSNPVRCDLCLEKSMKIKSGFINAWRNRFQAAFDQSRFIIAPNESVFEVMDRVYTIPGHKKLVIEHGHTKDLLDLPRDFDKARFHQPFCIAYVGFLDKSHKGLDTFYQLARSERLSQVTRWLIVGASELHHDPGFYPDYNVHVYGRYRDYSELCSILREQVDLVVHFSLGETFSFCLSEAWVAGIPALVADVGALQERVNRHHGGWTVDVTDIPSIEDTILGIISHPDEYHNIQGNLKHIPLKSIREVVCEYVVVYEKVMGTNQAEYMTFPTLSGSSWITVGTGDTCRMNLPARALKCYRENDLIYTIKRIFTYLRARSVERRK